jgi:hypothetical protein
VLSTVSVRRGSVGHRKDGLLTLLAAEPTPRPGLGKAHYVTDS